MAITNTRVLSSRIVVPTATAPGSARALYKGRNSNGETTWLMRFPNNAVGIPLGLAGQSIMWNTMSTAPFSRKIDVYPNWFFWVAALSALVIVLAIYVVKAVFHKEVVRFEWKDNVRSYFFYGPVLACLMLGIGAPHSIRSAPVLRALWAVAATVQLALTSTIYRRWLFSPVGHLGNARAVHQMSTVGWFFLCNLGQSVDLEGAWGINFPAMSFGAGAFFYSIIVTAIFQNLHEHPADKFHPSLFLLLAPPSVASLSIAGFQGSFATASQAVFGSVIVLLVMLLRLFRTMLEPPSTLGVYWAYVFPLSAVATAAVKYAEGARSVPSEVLAWTLVSGAVAMTCAVFCRFSHHQIAVMRGRELWNDPLLKRYSQHSQHPQVMESRDQPTKQGGTEATPQEV